MYQIGIFGDTGIVGRELEKILSNHDKVKVIFRKNSEREYGNLEECDLVFLATKAEKSIEYAPRALDLGAKVIDMSGAFRLKSAADFEKWYKIKHTSPELLKEAVYGLPAYYRDKIVTTMLVANPGCYPTSFILAMKPLQEYLQKHVFVVSTSGISGAGEKTKEESNERTYNYAEKHRHVPEINQYSGFDASFMPIVLESVWKGMNTHIIARLKLSKRLRYWLMHSDKEGIARELATEIRRSYCADDLVEIVEDNKGKNFGTRDVNYTHKAMIKIMGVDKKGFVYISSMYY